MKSTDRCLLMKIYSISVNLDKESDYITVGNSESADGGTVIVPGSHKSNFDNPDFGQFTMGPEENVRL